MATSRSITRRGTLKGMGATLGALSLRGFKVLAAAPAHFTHGVASGDPLSDRVILWTRALPGEGAARRLQGRWEVAEDLRFTKIIASGPFATGPERDYTVKVDAGGLRPGHRYWYRFIADGVTSPIGRTRTLPTGSVEQFRVGVCSCSNYPQGYFNVYRDMAVADLDLVLHLGDYIYEYGEGVYANAYAVATLGRGVVPQHEILALEDYRQRYGLYRTDPDLQAAHAAHPWICVWDDHELANDTWHSGAENHNEGEGDFAARIAAARRVYHEWMPIRSSPELDQGPIYRSFQVGDLADLIMLDTRLVGRDRQLDYRRDLLGPGHSPQHFKEQILANPDRSLLGEEQFQWLAAALAGARGRGATWQIVGQQVLMGKLNIPKISEAQLASMALPEFARETIHAMVKLGQYNLPMNLDAWDGYPAARERLYSLLLEQASNPVVVAGDTHNAWAFDLKNDAGASVGVWVGCPGVSSPGLESYFPLPPGHMSQLLRDSSPELVDLDTARRGWSRMTFTPGEMRSCWRFVSTVLDRDFEVQQSPDRVCTPGARRFS